MVRYDKGHSAKTRELIVEAASHLMREKGFNEASVPAVMKAVGLTHGGFYAHFADKTEMLAAALEKALLQSPINFAALAEMANAKGDAGLIAKYYLSDAKVADVASGCPAGALVSEVRRQEAPVLAAFKMGAEKTKEALAKTEGLERGHTWAALAMLVGGLAMMRAMPEGQTSHQMRDQIINAMRKLTEKQSKKS